MRAEKLAVLTEEAVLKPRWAIGAPWIGAPWMGVPVITSRLIPPDTAIFMHPDLTRAITDQGRTPE